GLILPGSAALLDAPRWVVWPTSRRTSTLYGRKRTRRTRVYPQCPPPLWEVGMADRELPGYATAIREARAARGWTRPRLAYEIEQVIKSDSERPPERDNLLRMIRSWENGEHEPKGHNRELLGRAFKMTEARLFEASRESLNLGSGWLDLYGTMMAALDPEGL